MNIPSDDEQKENLSSNVPWNANRQNKSTLGNWNTREAVTCLSNSGYLSSQDVNGQWIRKSYDIWAKRFINLKWGLLKARCGEFVVPRNINKLWLIPVTPDLALLANNENYEVSCADVSNLNQQLVQDSEYWLCRDPKNTMIFSNICPLNK